MDDNFANIKPYNFWGKSIKTGFVRNHYLSKLLDFKGSSLIKVLVGQRRVGKSFILRQYIAQIMKEGVHAENTLYINKEYTDFDFIENYQDLDLLIRFYLKKLKVKGKFYLFIDEVQRIEGWEKLINSLSQDYTKEVEIFITGSNSDLLSGELSTLLSGRYVQFLILPFSFDEFADFSKIEKNRHSFMKYLQEGGLPELLHLPNEETKRHYLASLRDTILLRDVIQRYQVKDSALLLDIFVYLVNNISNLCSINNIVNYFRSKNRKTSYETISNYIRYILQTFVVHHCDRFEIKGKEVLSGNVKYYANDLSFKNMLYSGFSHGYGYLLENLVFLELIKHDFVPYVGALRNKEIDFVALKNGKYLYIQVSFSLADPITSEREYAALLSVKDNYEKWVVSMDEIPSQEHQGVKHISAWELEEALKKF